MAADLKFLSLKNKFNAVLKVNILWIGCKLQCEKYAANYKYEYIIRILKILNKS